MQRLSTTLGLLTVIATGLRAQQVPQAPAAVSTDMLFFHDENAKMPDSAKSVIDGRLPAVKRDAKMRIVILDYGSSKDSMVVATRLNAVRGLLVTRSVAKSRIDVGTRTTGWRTDGDAIGPHDPQHTIVFILPSPGMTMKKAP
jgi:hypothetical protein